MNLLVLILILLLLFGGVPFATMNWGYGPGGVLGLILVVILILLLVGRI